MKFKVIRSRMLEALKKVQNVVAGKGSLQILQNVLIEAKDGKVKLTTTDLDISTQAEFECDVDDPGMTTLPVKLLFVSISKADEGEVEVKVGTDNRADILAGSARYRLQGMPAEEFPKIAEDGEAFVYTLQKATLREMLRKTAYAASQDDTRRTLKGVLMSFKDSKLTMVATDGRRLALVENELEFPKASEKDIVLPSKAVAELMRSLSVEGEASLLVQRSQICFRLGDMQIYSKLMEDNYPNYRQVIPKNCREHIVLDRQLLLNALDRASVMTVDESHSTKLCFEANKLTVMSAASDIGEAKDEVAVKYIGEKIDIMLNPDYVMDCLKSIDDDEVTIDINDGHSPVVIRCSIPFLYVLMPLRTT